MVKCEKCGKIFRKENICYKFGKVLCPKCFGKKDLKEETDYWDKIIKLQKRVGYGNI